MGAEGSVPPGDCRNDRQDRLGLSTVTFDSTLGDWEISRLNALTPLETHWRILANRRRKLVLTPVAVEKVRFAQNSQNFEDRKCLPEARTSFVGHPNAKFFRAFSRE
jgi:hypothetical protein